MNVTTLGTTPVTYTLASVPSCVQVNALVRAFMYNTSVAVNGLLIPAGDGSTASYTPAGNVMFNTAANFGGAGAFTLRTSTSQQIKAVASAASTTLVLATYGWIDTRGRFN